MPFKSSLTVGLFSYHGVASPDNAKHLSSEMIFGKTSPTAFCSSVRKKRIFELKLLAVQSRMKLGIWIATGLPVHTEEQNEVYAYSFVGDGNIFQKCENYRKKCKWITFAAGCLVHLCLFSFTSCRQIATHQC